MLVSGADGQLFHSDLQWWSESIFLSHYVAGPFCPFSRIFSDLWPFTVEPKLRPFGKSLCCQHLRLNSRCFLLSVIFLAIHSYSCTTLRVSIPKCLVVCLWRSGIKVISLRSMISVCHSCKPPLQHWPVWSMVRLFRNCWESNNPYEQIIHVNDYKNHYNKYPI